MAAVGAVPSAHGEARKVGGALPASEFLSRVFMRIILLLTRPDFGAASRGGTTTAIWPVIDLSQDTEGATRLWSTSGIGLSASGNGSGSGATVSLASARLVSSSRRQ